MRPKCQDGRNILMVLWNDFKKVFSKKTKKVKIAVNATPVSGSWGGGNQWLIQLSRMADFMGFELVYQLDADVDCIIVLHSADNQGASFNASDIANHRKKFPKTKCIHRINENDARKGTNFMDAAIANMNVNADHTVFVSSWLRDYHLSKWFSKDLPHEVIINGSDSRFFHPFGSSVWNESLPLILVTHHWSDNWNKGFDVYKEIDEKISSGCLKNVEFRVIGRWPKEIQWKNAKTYPPVSGNDLANQLRECHAYVTGTRNEPGAMHYIEGLQCGLPLIYRHGGGGVEEVGLATGGIGFTDNVSKAIEELKSSWLMRRQSVLANLPSGERMAFRYLEIVEQLLLK